MAFGTASARSPAAGPTSPARFFPPPRPASQLAQPTLPPTVIGDVVDQAIALKLHHEVNRAHLLARTSVIMIKGVGAMAMMMTHALTQHQIEVLNTRKGLLAHDVHYAAPLRILLLSS